MESEFHEPSFGAIVELIQQYEEAVESKQTVFFEQESFEQIIEFYEENNELNKALKVVELALHHYPFSSSFHTKKAEILANQKQFLKAMKSLEVAETLDPHDINIFLIRADVHLWEGRHAQAMAQVEYAMSFVTTPEDKCELYLEMADIYEDQERLDEMTESLKKALYEDPENEEGLNRFWFCTELTEKHEESVAFHKELLDLKPYSYFAWFNLGHAYAGLGEFESSLEAFGFVIAIDENFDSAYICSADVLCNMQRHEEAIQYYLDAIKLSKPNKELFVKTGECFEKLNDITKGRSYYRKAIALDPNYDEAFFKLGETYRAEGNWIKAISSYERAVKIDKDNVDYLAVLAEAYLNIDEKDKAVEAFERVFQLDPESKQSWISLATVYFDSGDFRKTFQLLTEAEQKFESNADIFYIKSVLYLQIGNKHEGLLNLERGLLSNFEEHPIVFEMDDALRSNHAVLQVIEQYRQ